MLDRFSFDAAGVDAELKERWLSASGGENWIGYLDRNGKVKAIFIVLKNRGQRMLAYTLNASESFWRLSQSKLLS